MSERNIPPGGNNLHSQFGSLNIEAQPFVPNARAAPFVPVASGGHPPPGYMYMQGGYNPSMGVHHQMPPQGASGYGRMPAQQHGGMGVPYNPRYIPEYHQSQVGGAAMPSHQHRHPGYPGGGPRHHQPHLQQQQQQPQVFPPHHAQAPHPPHSQHQPHSVPQTLDSHPSEPKNSSSQQSQKPPSIQLPQDDPVDSWEQMAGDEDSNNNSSSSSSQVDGDDTVSSKKVEEASVSGQSGELQQKTQKEKVKEATKERSDQAKSALSAPAVATSVQSTSEGSSAPSNNSHNSSGGSSGCGGSGGSSKKNPSPNLSKSSRADGSSKGAQAVVPPRDKEEKENVNVIFIGHVDAGKSTIGGHIMYLTGQVDKRTLEKYEREAKEKNRETWYLSWALDTNQEERDKGKTVEVGRAFFETQKKRFTILDAPGHAGFVPNMIGGAAQADVGVLVISARKGEFETGFERKGQTREHAMLAKTAGVKHLVILINKMDDPTVEWVEERFEECKTKLTPFLKKVGFNPKTDVFFIPVSGLTGANLKESSSKCIWYKGPPFITYLDSLPPIVREDSGILRIPIADKHKDMGTLVMGKIESGAVMKGSSLLLMPNKMHVEVLQVIRVEEEVTSAYAGDNVKLRLKGVEEEDISPGFVLCDPSSPCSMGQVFDAQIVVLEYKSIICAGYTAVLHIHTVVEEVQIVALKALIERKTGKVSARNPRFVKQDQVVIATLQTSGVICVEKFSDFPQMARFTLRDEGKTVAIGKVLKLLGK